MMTISVAARQSPLSRAQVTEIHQELHQHHPSIVFKIKWLLTSGDKNHSISLRSLGKTDFFTKEIDDLLITDKCRLGIHSAKDLADPLRKGLSIVALTKGIDNSDILVLRSGATLESLPKSAFIATSSERREENVRKLREDIHFTDIRGTIGERLDQLTQGKVDGVVIAKAALIRLGLNDLNEVLLPGTTTPLQGQLAVIARSEDYAMHELFKCLDSREKYR